MSDKLPWSKQEIIDAVLAKYKPVDPDDVSTTESAVCIEAIARLVRGRRAAPHLEWALFNRTLRIHQALCDGRDPYVAYDVPLDDEESRTPGNQRVFKDWLEETIAQGPWEDLFNIIARCAAPSRRDARGGEDLDAAYDALRRKPVRIVKYLHQHVLDLCNKHGITIYAWCWSTAYCHALIDRNAIRIAWIRSRSTYAAALHEIGHLRGQYQDSDSTSAREHGAWEWARANALVWTPGMEKSARKAERWYVLHAFWIDQPVQLKHSAYHEAGHAVIARVLGLLGGSATIAANHLLKSYGSSESDLDATVVYWRWPISEGGDKKLALRSLSCAYRAKVMELMAGREAELECLGPRKNSCLGLDDGDRIDLADVDALMPKIYLNRKEWPRRQDRLRRMTRALVRRHRDEIECIARALLLNRTLSASAIDFLLPRIPAPAARCIELAGRERKPARPFEGGNQ